MLLRRNSQMHWVYMTCLATCGSGARTSTEAIQLPGWLAPQDPRLARIVWCAAALGTTNPVTAVARSATTTTRTTPTPSSGFVPCGLRRTSPQRSLRIRTFIYPCGFRSAEPASTPPFLFFFLLPPSISTAVTLDALSAAFWVWLPMCSSKQLIEIISCATPDKSSDK